jgi:hypothetical protein
LCYLKVIFIDSVKILFFFIIENVSLFIIINLPIMETQMSEEHTKPLNEISLSSEPAPANKRIGSG